MTQAVRSKSGFRVVDLLALMTMKLQSYRLVDQVHLVDMKGVGLVTPAIVANLPADLRERWERLPEADTH